MATIITCDKSSKTGLSIGDYGNTADGSGYVGWVEPACDNPSWILWFTENGDADLYTQREENGAIVGEPIRLKGVKAKV